MREIVYAGGSFVTSDDIADALLEYAAALANAERAATVQVPAVSPVGESADVKVVIGPSSQLLSEPVVDHAGEEPDGAAFVADVDSRLTQLTRPYKVPDPLSTLDWDI